ncbi:acetyl-CoA C-acetyltransferase [Chryseobacterium soldanellicola]|uniref:Acetyl-CoA C-acetyltransferase n=1 Tax=Chryseobacterium soldanellicola TaxID=311333 RepID=A0A1H0XMH2_9FLAO|nr:acetyl-CoA C-acyltransferase [Chryseobacterium soldanellicola]SDQ04115.1 acetyl-CoA C-acetyltransferase [Chryseobacterium soldanellicola]
MYIVAAKRTPVGGFLGSLSHYSAPKLGAIAIEAAIEQAAIPKTAINEVILGNVLSANIGQSPARQASKFAGIPDEVDATTINKVCSSGLKSVVFAAQSIDANQFDFVIAGGMESMSNAPFYIENHRKGNKSGNGLLIDGMIKDGLWDPYNNFHMGSAAELVNKKYGITRAEQDEYAISSYNKAKAAHESGFFDREIVAVNGITKDEDIDKLKEEKVPNLKPIFEEDGSITAANASNLNDGAAALIIASEESLKKYNIQPLAKIIAYADAAQAPEWFTTSPILAIQKVLAKANLETSDIDFFEINEAYANVAIINARLGNLDLEKINIHGGGVSIGHPIGASGARILTTLIYTLMDKNAKYGIAALCNGGGGSTALLIENTQLK